MNESMDDLLAQLSSGDAAAIEQVFREYEPYLRNAVRRQFPDSMRGKFDSADIFQSVWTDLLRGFRESAWRFRDADHLRGFLFVAMRNRLIDRVRQQKGKANREEHLGEVDRTHRLPSPQPRPSEIAAANELWQRILAQCPPEHRQILGLKRQGCSLAEIAKQTNLHPDSIRRILRTLARQMAFQDTSE